MMQFIQVLPRECFGVVLLERALVAVMARHSASFKTEKRDLVIHSAAVAGELSVRADHTMAWNDYAEGIPAHRTADRP